MDHTRESRNVDDVTWHVTLEHVAGWTSEIGATRWASRAKQVTGIKVVTLVMSRWLSGDIRSTKQSPLLAPLGALASMEESGIFVSFDSIHQTHAHIWLYRIIYVFLSLKSFLCKLLHLVVGETGRQLFKSREQDRGKNFFFNLYREYCSKTVR